MRRASRKDALHQAVGNVFRQNGWSMLDTSNLGDGKPDWVAFKTAFAIMVEVKTPGWQRPSDDTQSKQQKFSDGWQGCPIYTVETVEQAWKVAESIRPFQGVV